MQRNLDSLCSDSFVTAAEYAQELVSLGYECGMPVSDPWHPLSNVDDVSEAVERAYRAVAGESFAGRISHRIRNRPDFIPAHQTARLPRGYVAAEARILGVSDQTWRNYRNRKAHRKCGPATFARMVEGVSRYARGNNRVSRALSHWETRRAVAAALIGADASRALGPLSPDDDRYTVELLGLARALSDESKIDLIRHARALYADERMFSDVPKR